MGKAFKWMAAARGANTVVLATDGRSKKVRKQMELALEESQGDEQKQVEGCILHREPCPGDIRFPKRNTFLAV